MPLDRREFLKLIGLAGLAGATGISFAKDKPAPVGVYNAETNEVLVELRLSAPVLMSAGMRGQATGRVVENLNFMCDFNPKTDMYIAEAMDLGEIDLWAIDVFVLSEEVRKLPDPTYQMLVQSAQFKMTTERHKSGISVKADDYYSGDLGWSLAHTHHGGRSSTNLMVNRAIMAGDKLVGNEFYGRSQEAEETSYWQIHLQGIHKNDAHVT